MLSATSKLHLIIQCRFNSNRLPGKALLPFLNHSLLGFLIQRLKQHFTSSDTELVVITSDQESDVRIYEEALKNQVNCFRGNLNHVYTRYLQYLTSLINPPEYFARITADNPLTCPYLIDELLQQIQIQDLDYIQSKDHPIGVGVDLFKTKTFMNIPLQSLSQEEQEHINLYYLNHPLEYQMKFWSCPWKYRLPHSVTIDTADQYKDVLSIVEQTSPNHQFDFRV